MSQVLEPQIPNRYINPKPPERPTPPGIFPYINPHTPIYPQENPEYITLYIPLLCSRRCSRSFSSESRRITLAFLQLVSGSDLIGRIRSALNVYVGLTARDIGNYFGSYIYIYTYIYIYISLSLSLSLIPLFLRAL